MDPSMTEWSAVIGANARILYRFYTAMDKLL